MESSGGDDLTSDSARVARRPIEALVNPRNVAIAGASTDPGRLGSLPLAFLLKHGYRGRIYPINPNADEIRGIKCCKSVAEIDEPVDLDRKSVV